MIMGCFMLTNPALFSTIETPDDSTFKLPSLLVDPNEWKVK
jgi:hypothetical protein